MRIPFDKVCLSVCMCTCSCLTKPEEGARFSEAVVVGKFEPPDMGAGSLTGVFHKSHKSL